MSITAIVGANWGDEGKGKTTDYLAADADIVVRCQGGANAGHTIINDYGKFVLRLLPSGVFSPDAINVLGPGVALNTATLFRELGELEQRDVPRPRLRVSSRAQVILPFHPLLDVYEEERWGRPVYERLPGWRCGVSEVRNFDDLPKNAQAPLKPIRFS
jgi:adenylosuccinate synthase